MFEPTMLEAVAVGRMSDARHAADAHRQRRLLRRDARSLLATWLQGLALRLDARAGGPAGAPPVASQGFATDRELCRAA